MIRLINSFGRPSKAENIRFMQLRGETILDYIIRELTAEDLPTLVDLHVKTWMETYPGVKRPPTQAIRAQQWQAQWNVQDGSWFCYVVHNQKGELIGFVHGRLYDQPDLPQFSGELNKIYLLRAYQRLGLGRRMLGYAVRRFISLGIDSMVCFATPENPSCTFYDKLGGTRLLDSGGVFQGGYGWKDLPQLAALCPV